MRSTDGSVSVARPMSGTSSRSRLTHRDGLCDPGLPAAQMRPIELPLMELWYQRQPREAYLSAHHLLGALPDRPLSTPRFILLYIILYSLFLLHLAHLKII